MEIRLLTRDDIPAFQRSIDLAFGWEPTDEHTERLEKTFELRRMFGAFDGSSLVGTGGAFSFDMTTPGGSVPCGGTTVITVIPSHRRRGALTRMMEFHLDEVSERGEPVAALWASESGIYGRYGYGVSAYHAQVTMERSRIEFRHNDPPLGQVHILGTEEAKTVVPPIYESIRPQRPGFMTRDETMRWENGHFFDPSSERNGATAKRWAVYEGHDGPMGYAVYRQKDNWQDGMPHGDLLVGEVLGVTAEAEEALWRFLLGVDLIGTVKAWNVDPGAAIHHLVKDSRRVKRGIADGLWVRILDVPRALAARTYQVPGRLVFDVTDGFGKRASGRFELEASPGGAECLTTDGEADITLDVRELGSVYLGGVTFHELYRAGLVAGDGDALATADLMFGYHRPPWCPEVF